VQRRGSRTVHRIAFKIRHGQRTVARRGAVGADRLVQARAGDGRVTRFDGGGMTIPDSRFPINPAASAEASQRRPGELSRQKSDRLAHGVAASREGR
jgi:hypothetical protein